MNRERDSKRKSTMQNGLSRRNFLRGAGVALSLPLLPSLLFRRNVAQAQVAGEARRFVSLYFPNGTADFWRPKGGGAGDGWQLSPILEPLSSVKSHMSVLTNIANYSPFGGHVEPSHPNCCASTWTCVKASGEGNRDNGISVDQVIANQLSGQTPLHSLQLGLSTLDSYEDGMPGQHSRSISWKSPTEPLYKIVNPQAVFDRLVSGRPAPTDGDAAAEAAHRRSLNKSVLDYVLDDAASLQRRLDGADRARLDQYMTSVRSLEQRIAGFSPTVASPAACPEVARPDAIYGVGNTPADYDRDAHSDLMIDLLVMAFQCDMTRVASFMLDDARSDFVYDFLTERLFTDEGSTAGSGRVAGYHGLQHAGDRNNGYATIGHWNAQQAARLAGRLLAVPTGDGGSLLDDTVIVFCSGMHSGNHDSGDLPVALLGGGGRTAGGQTVLRMDEHFQFGNEQRMADLHLTLIRQVFGCEDTQFGTSAGIIDGLLS